MASDLQRIARDLLATVEEIPQYVTRMQLVSDRCRHNAQVVLALTGRNQPGKAIAARLYAAADACDRAVQACLAVRDGGRRWAEGTVAHAPEAARTTPAPAIDHRSEAPGTGWDVPRAARHPNRPDLTAFRLPDRRWTHIVDGDKTGGGHSYGTGSPGKSEFPHRWSDADTKAFILATARAPATATYEGARATRPPQWRCTAKHDDVLVVVIVREDASIWTAYPKEGSRREAKSMEAQVVSQFPTDDPMFIEAVLALPAHYADRLDQDQRERLRDDAEAGEWGQTLEQLVVDLANRGSVVTTQERGHLVKLYRTAGIDQALLDELTVRD